MAGAAIVSALQPLVSRETSPTDGAVVTVSRFNTGIFLYVMLRPSSRTDPA